jgi:hypothetical protein
MSTLPRRALKTGQTCSACSAALLKPSSSRPETRPLTSRTTVIIFRLPTSSVQVALMSSSSGVLPCSARVLESQRGATRVRDRDELLGRGVTVGVLGTCREADLGARYRTAARQIEAAGSRLQVPSPHNVRAPFRSGHTCLLYICFLGY